MLRIALIAHHAQKNHMGLFVARNQPFFKKVKIIATGGTAKLLETINDTFDIEAVSHGPDGGDVEIAFRVVHREVDAVIFFRDLDTCQPHEPDVTTLLRMCSKYDIPLALNYATAYLLVRGLESGDSLPPP